MLDKMDTFWDPGVFVLTTMVQRGAHSTVMDSFIEI